MPTISQLTATYSLTDTDQIPVYSTNNGDARKASLSTLKAYLLSTGSFAASGANSDITSLSGLTTPLSASQGGTGLFNPGPAGRVLTSTGSGWEASSPVTGMATDFSNATAANPVATGGTGVTASSGANSVTLRDANANISVNNAYTSYSNTAAAGTITTLTAASAFNFVVTGSGGQTLKLPDATTLPAGATYVFNNNQSSGTLVVQNNSLTTVVTIQSGSIAYITLLANTPAAGSWDIHYELPSNVAWSTNTLSWTGTIASGTTWNGVAIGASYGGTGLTTPGTAGNVLTSNGAGGWTSSAPSAGVSLATVFAIAAAL